jgi:isoamylase
MRNFLTTLLLSQGVPMLVAGDELGRTQDGNNNAYCQDNPLSWLRWDQLEQEGHDLLEFTARLVALRRRHIVFHRTRFFRGEVIPGTDAKDVIWLRPDGTEMTHEDWAEERNVLGIRLSGEAGLMHVSARGEQELDDTFVILMNASDEPVEFRIPEEDGDGRWALLVDTTSTVVDAEGETHLAGDIRTLTERSLVVLARRVERDGGELETE